MAFVIATPIPPTKEDKIQADTSWNIQILNVLSIDPVSFFVAILLNKNAGIRKNVQQKGSFFIFRNIIIFFRH